MQGLSRKTFSGVFLLALFVSTIVFSALPVTHAQSSADRIFAVTASNKLVQFSSSNPGTLAVQRAITGLVSGDEVLGIDFRPATGELFALSNSNRLYTLNTLSGAATLVGTQPFTSTAIGSAFGFDFNPSVDRIRLVSDTRVDLRLNPNNGALAATDGQLTYATGDTNAAVTPRVVAAGYTNNISGTTSTQLYVIDTQQNVLARQGTAGPPVVSPNTGQLFTVGALGLDAGDLVGLDITPDGNAYVSVTGAMTTTSQFGTIDLTSGSVTIVGTVGGGEAVRDIAIATKPLPPPPATNVFAVTTSNKLVQFSSATPGTIASTHSITGLMSGDEVLGIDFRPATGELFALSSSNRLYTLNSTNGAATLVGTQPFTSTAIGSAFGFDFNPSVDRIRLVSDTRVDLRLNPNNGALAATDGQLTYATGDTNAAVTPRVVAAGYTNNISGTTSTQLYVIDTQQNVLARQGTAGPPVVSPNTGQLFTVGALGLDAGDLVGLDITPDGNAFVSTTASSASETSFGTIDLATGSISSIGTIGGGEAIRDIALAAGPVGAADYEVYLPIVVKQ